MPIQEMQEQSQPRYLLKTDQGQWRSDSQRELKDFLRTEFGKRQFLYAELIDTHTAKVMLNVDRAGMLQWTNDSFKEFKGSAKLQETDEYRSFMSNQPRMFSGGDQP